MPIKDMGSLNMYTFWQRSSCDLMGISSIVRMLARYPPCLPSPCPCGVTRAPNCCCWYNQLLTKRLTFLDHPPADNVVNFSSALMSWFYFWSAQSSSFLDFLLPCSNVFVTRLRSTAWHLRHKTIQLYLCTKEKENHVNKKQNKKTLALFFPFWSDACFPHPIRIIMLRTL